MSLKPFRSVKKWCSFEAQLLVVQERPQDGSKHLSKPQAQTASQLAAKGFGDDKTTPTWMDVHYQLPGVRIPKTPSQFELKRARKRFASWRRSRFFGGRQGGRNQFLKTKENQ